MFVIVAFIVVGVVSAAHSVADEAPISGTVKAIETSGKTLTLQTTAQGKTRDVTIVLKPETKIVKFARPTEPGKTGFVEQTARVVRPQAGLVRERHDQARGRQRDRGDRHGRAGEAAVNW